VIDIRIHSWCLERPDNAKAAADRLVSRQNENSRLGGRDVAAASDVAAAGDVPGLSRAKKLAWKNHSPPRISHLAG
jgi:hypothetical protein